MTDVKFLRRFNLVVFSILFLMGIGVFFWWNEKLDDYIRFAGVVTTVLIPLVIAGAAGSPVKHFIENQRTKNENRR